MTMTPKNGEFSRLRMRENAKTPRWDQCFFNACPDGLKKDGHLHLAPPNLKFVLWPRTQNLILLWTALSNFFDLMPLEASKGKTYQKFEFPAWRCQIDSIESQFPGEQNRRLFWTHLGNPLSYIVVLIILACDLLAQTLECGNSLIVGASKRHDLSPWSWWLNETEAKESCPLSRKFKRSSTCGGVARNSK